MPTYSWTGYDKQGQPVHGEFQAQNEQEAALALRNSGISSAQLKRTKDNALQKGVTFRRGVPLFELLGFTRRLGFMLESELTIKKALRTLEGETGDSRMAKVAAALRRDVDNGLTLSDAMERHPEVFDDLYVEMVRAGEVGGALPRVLDRLGHEMERIRRIVRQVRAAMTYPIIVLIISFVAFLGMMTLLIPRMMPLYDQLGGGTELPAYTRFMLEVSGFFAPPDGGILPVRPVLALTWMLVSLLVMYLIASIKLVPSRGAVFFLGFGMFIAGCVAISRLDKLAISIGQTEVFLATAMRMGMFMLLGIAIAAAFRSYLNTEDGRWVWDRTKLRLPFKLGRMIQLATLARYAGVLGALYSAGIRLPQGIRMSGNASGSMVYRRASDVMYRNLQAGMSPSDAMRPISSFTPFFVQMLETGEEAGVLDKTLDRVAVYYEEEVDEYINNVSSIVTPVMLLIAGVLVIGVLLALYIPLFGAYEAINNQVI